MLRTFSNFSGTAILLIVVILSFSPAESQVPDGVPSLISYQGRLTDAAGDPVPDGEYLITFAIWSDSISTDPGDRKWISPDCPVLVINGLFNWQLGSRVPLPPEIFVNDTALWLGVKVGDDSELMPRRRVASNPFAGKALYADHAGYADSAGRTLSSNILVQARVETLATIGRQIYITFPIPFGSPPGLAVTAYVKTGQHTGKVAYIESMIVQNDRATLNLQAWDGLFFQDIADGMDIQVSWTATGTHRIVKQSQRFYKPGSDRAI